MLRATLLRLADDERLRRLVTRGGWTRDQALRFVAGETLDDGFAVVDRLRRGGRSATLDHLGEAVTTMAEARAACETYLAALDRIAAGRLDCGVSVKPTQMGLHIDAGECHGLIGSIAETCDRAGVHLCLDMEGSDVTEATVALVEQLRSEGHDDVGCAVQAYLHRTPGDIERLSRAGASLRLCKGAYAEPPTIAHTSRLDVDRSYARCADRLLRTGRYPRLATHDSRLIDYVRYAAVREQRGAEDWELQMLYGVRDDLQRELVSEGLRLRVYVPFGRQWYPYLMRRIAERPANLVFFLRALAGSSTAER